MSTPPLVCICGTETFLAERALAALESEVLAGGDPSLNRQVFVAPDAKAAEVVAAAKTLPFLGGRRLVVLRDCQRWTADEWKRALPYLEAPNPSTCLVLVADQIDRRTGAGKALVRSARWVECRKPKERELYGWAERLAREAGLRTGRSVLEVLCSRVDVDLQLLHREIEKLRAFAGEEGRLTESEVATLVGDTRGASVFALCDALGNRDLSSALRAFRKLLQLGEAPQKLLFMVVRHYRHLWTMRALLDGGARVDRARAAAELGLPPFAAQKVMEQARNWRGEQLREAFDRFLEADLCLKSGAGVEVVDRLLVSLCGLPPRKTPPQLRGRSSSRLQRTAG